MNILILKLAFMGKMAKSFPRSQDMDLTKGVGRRMSMIKTTRFIKYFKMQLINLI